MTVDKNLENTTQEVQQCKEKIWEHPEVFSLALSNYDKKEQIYEYAKKADLYPFHGYNKNVNSGNIYVLYPIL